MFRSKFVGRLARTKGRPAMGLAYKTLNVMIKSMTGYGKGIRTWQGKKMTMEIKSVNSKVLDMNWRWSGPYKELENDLRALVTDRLQRGKVDIYVTVRDEAGEAGRLPELRTTFLEKAYRQFAQWSASQTEPMPGWWPAVLGQAFVMQSDAWHRPEEVECTPEELAAAGVQLRALADEVLQAVDRFRTQEAEGLKKDLLLRVSLIEEKLAAVEPFEKGRLARIKEKLTKALQEWNAQWESQPDSRNRFEESLIYYLEKWDVTEEKVRLAKHCRYFRESIDEDGAGKKLGFIAQEMGREINTLGSKSNEVEMQRLVVEMKDELEKIKEQLFNIL